jgi:hypothetical protein
MVPTMTTILRRFTGEWAALLQPETILTVCGETEYTGWCDRLLTPVTTVQLFLLQILHGNTACSHLLHLSGLRCRAAAYCQARAKLPLHLFTSSSSASKVLCNHPPWTRGGGMAIAPFLSMARDAHACYSCLAGCVRPAGGVAAWVRLSRGAAARPRGLPCRRSRRALPPARASRNRAGASQDHDTHGCAAL